uniref:Uncharacterized protein n=1 Tax=Cacopsylla melanoneura TaxID=428564 RepID=A0A8D8Q9V9_9HEMI
MRCKSKILLKNSADHYFRVRNTTRAEYGVNFFVSVFISERKSISELEHAKGRSMSLIRGSSFALYSYAIFYFHVASYFITIFQYVGHNNIPYKQFHSMFIHIPPDLFIVVY